MNDILERPHDCKRHNACLNVDTNNFGKRSKVLRVPASKNTVTNRFMQA